MSNLKTLKPPKKGEIRNPAGRPKGSRNRSTIAKEWLEVNMQQKNPITKQVETMEVQDALTLAMIGRAMKGDVAAFKELMDSAYGKLQNFTDITTKGESLRTPIKIEFEDFSKKNDINK